MDSINQSRATTDLKPKHVTTKQRDCLEKLWRGSGISAPDQRPRDQVYTYYIYIYIRLPLLGGEPSVGVCSPKKVPSPHPKSMSLGPLTSSPVAPDPLHMLPDVISLPQRERIHENVAPKSVLMFLPRQKPLKTDVGLYKIPFIPKTGSC